MSPTLFVRKHLRSVVNDLLDQSRLSWKMKHPARKTDFEIRIGRARFMAGVLLSRSGVHFSEKVRQLGAVAKKSRGIPLLAAPSLSPRRRAALKQSRVCYLDLVGNAWLLAPGLFIDRRGRRTVDAYRARESWSPFSDKASLILRTMMEDPHRAWGNNAIAGEAGINAGWASQICRRLEQLGYVVRSEDRTFKIFKPHEVLEDWADHYRLRKQSEYRFKLGGAADGTMERVLYSRVLKRHGGLFSFHAGASLLVPHDGFDEVHVYCQGLPSSLNAWREELGLEEVRSGGDLILVDPYYTQSHRHGSRKVDGYPVVSDIQLYLDLRTLRGAGESAARRMLEERIAPAWHA